MKNYATFNLPNLPHAFGDETPNTLGCSKSTVSDVMTVYTKLGKMGGGAGKHNSGRKRKLADKDRGLEVHSVSKTQVHSFVHIVFSEARPLFQDNNTPLHAAKRDKE